MNRPDDVAAAFESAWNSHSMDSFAALFCDDASFVNRFGHYVRGVSEIVAMHQPIHETIYRDSKLANELIDVISLGERAAVVHFWSRLSTGAAHPAGHHELDTLILAVVVWGNGQWRIQALENVSLTDPRTGELVLRY